MGRSSGTKSALGLAVSAMERTAAKAHQRTATLAECKNTEDYMRFANQKEEDANKMEKAIERVDVLWKEWRTIIAEIADEAERAKEQQDFDSIVQAVRVKGEKTITGFPHLIDFVQQLIFDCREAASGAKVEIEIINAKAAKVETPAVQPTGQAEVKVDPTATPTPVAPPLPTVRLQALELPTFNGNIKQSRAFWQAFDGAVHSSAMTGSQKMSYLIRCMKGPALEAVQRFPATDDGYNRARERLKKRFGNDLDVKRALRRELYTPWGNVDKLTDLRRKFEQFEAAVEQLQDMQENVETDEFRTLLETQLPLWIVERLEEKRNETDELTTKDMRILVDTLISTRERAEITRSKNNSQKAKDTQVSAAVSVSQSGQQKAKAKDHWTTSKTESTTPAESCAFCGRKHPSAACRTVSTVDERRQVVKDKSLCFKCLQPGHRVFRCKAKPCAKCGKRHNASLCTEGEVAAVAVQQPTPKSTSQPAPQPESANVVATVTEKPKRCLVMTAKAHMLNPQDNSQRTEVLLFFDPGSTCSFIRDDMPSIIGLQSKGTECTRILRLGDTEPVETIRQLFDIQLETANGDIETISVKDSSNLVPVHTTEVPRTYEEQIEWTTMPIPVLVEVPHLLIGVDYFGRFMNDVPPLVRGDLIIWSTKFGPVVSGPVETSNITRMPEVTTSTFEVVSVLQDVKSDTDKLYSLDILGITDDPLTKDEEMADKLFAESVKKVDGRYSVSFPVHDLTDLPRGYGMCLKRLEKLQIKLMKNPELREKYVENMNNQKLQTIVEEVPEDEIWKEKGVHYNPHSGKETPAKETTKLRIINDGSAKENSMSKGLNDCLYPGKSQLPTMAFMLIRSRCGRILVSSDIEKAFLMVMLNKPDRDLVRLLWLRDPTLPPTPKNLVHLRYCRVPFGTCSSSYLLQSVVTYHLESYGEEHPDEKEIVEELKNCMYVDNCMQLADNAEQAIAKGKLAIEIFAEIGMNLRQFCSNSEAVNSFFKVTKEMDKFLGIPWDIKEDTYIIAWPSCENIPDTKRKLVSYAASVYDPLMWTAPAMTPIKRVIQELWRIGSSWDKKVPPAMLEIIRTIMEGYQNAMLRIPRKMFSAFEAESYELHVFGDASGDAYAAVAYVVQQKAGIREVSMIMAKGLMAPLNKMTIPRLELVAQALAALIAKCVINGVPWKHDRIVLWSDSTTTLSWINVSDEKARFVNNRARKLRATGYEFRYVPTADNPADIATRGCSPQELTTHPLWFNGPKWLKMSDENWPERPVMKKVNEEKDTLPDLDMIAATTQEEEIPDPILDASKFSSWLSMVRVAAFVLLLIQRVIPKFRDRLPEWIPKARNAEWQLAAERMIIRQIQRQLRLTQKRRNELAIYEDNDGWIRRRSRLHNAKDVDDEVKDPLMLVDCQATQLLILQMHKKLLHGSPMVTLAEFRSRFSMIKAGQVIKRTIRRHCMTCRKHNARPFALPPMPDLPTQRVSLTTPFQHVGIDYAGPFTVKSQGEAVKGWVALFVCMATRAIHLEVVLSADAQQFINAFRRFVARRGRPDSVITDNGGNFVRAAKVLVPEWVTTKNDEVLAYCATERITWKFITERAPWHGGFYERMVGLVKNAMKKTIGRRQLILDDFRTWLCEAEAAINSRPLTAVVEDECHILRPIDFLLPHGQIGLPPIDVERNNDPDFTDKDDAQWRLTQLWNKTRGNLEKFASIWKTDYLLALRDKMNILHGKPSEANHRSPEADEVVLVEDEEQPKTEWRLGKVLETPVGADGKIRTAKVQMANGRILNRSIAHLYPLEVSPSLVNKPGTVRRVPIAMVMTVIMLAWLCPASEAAECLRNDVQVHRHFLPSQLCAPKGYAIVQLKEGVKCWMKVQCPGGMVTSTNGTGCGNPCECPSWAAGCSFYHTWRVGNSTISDPQTAITLQEEAPEVCSFVPHPECAPTPVKERFHQIQLLDDSIHVVRSIDLVFKELHEGDIECAGEGPVDGPPEYCDSKTCDPKGSRFCFPQQHSIAMWSTGANLITVKAWGIVGMMVYPPRMARMLEFSAACQKATILVNGTMNGDMIEIYSPRGSLLEPATTNGMTLQLPNWLAVQNHEFQIRKWSKGKLMKSLRVACEEFDFCAQIPCNFCAERWANAHCATPMAIIYAGISLGILIVILLTLSTYLCCRKHGAAKKSLLRRIIEARCRCKRRRSSSPILEFRYRRRDSWFAKATAVALCSLMSKEVSSCAQVSSISASDTQCQVTATGFKTCHYKHATTMTIPSESESCLLFKDDGGRPQFTMKILMKVIHVCEPVDIAYTRLAQIHVSSSKRCRGAGQCTGYTCANLPLNSTIPELNAYHEFPGYTRCVASEGCWGNGCFICQPACTFYRIYAVPTNEAVLETFNCVWKRTVELTVSSSGDQRATSRKTTLSPGESTKFGQVTVTVQSVQTSVSYPKAVFIRQADRTAVLDDIGIATAKLLKCRSREEANSGNCLLDINACSCEPADGTLNCFCRDNGLLRTQLERRALPRNIDGAVIDGGSIISKRDPTAMIALHIDAEHLTAATQMDVNKCTVEKAEITGCRNCAVGATVSIKCRTDFASTMAHVKCENGMEFAVRCREQATMDYVRLQATESHVDTTCSLQCPANKATFSLTGTMITITATDLPSHPATKLIATPTSLESFSSFLSNVLSGVSLSSSLLLVVVVVIVLLLK